MSEKLAPVAADDTTSVRKGDHVLYIGLVVFDPSIHGAIYSQPVFLSVIRGTKIHASTCGTNEAVALYAAAPSQLTTCVSRPFERGMDTWLH